MAYSYVWIDGKWWNVMKWKGMLVIILDCLVLLNEDGMKWRGMEAISSRIVIYRNTINFLTPKLDGRGLS